MQKKVQRGPGALLKRREQEAGRRAGPEVTTAMTAAELLKAAGTDEVATAGAAGTAWEGRGPGGAKSATQWIWATHTRGVLG